MKRLCLLLVFFIINIPVGFSLENENGFSLGATRIIYLSNKNNATISVYNTAQNSPLLIQSWISDAQGNTNVPFIVTPPLYRQDNGNNILRIVRTGGNLASDKESLFLLNVKAIAASPVPFRSKNTTDNNQLASKVNLSFVNQIKLFYRPAALQPDAAEAYQKLQFSQSNHQLLVKNPTPYYITLHDLVLNHQSLLNQPDAINMVAPFSQIQFPIKNTASQLSYTTINDFGSLTAKIDRMVN